MRSGKQQNQKRKNNVGKTPLQKEFDKFRHEIYKFGLTGFDKKEQIDARYELAIKLGAKPKRWIKPNKGLGEDNKPKQPKQKLHDGATGEVGKHIEIDTAPATRTSQRGRS